MIANSSSAPEWIGESSKGEDPIDDGIRAIERRPGFARFFSAASSWSVYHRCLPSIRFDFSSGSVLNPSFEPARLLLDSAGTPVSEVYGDVYHSAAGGHAQARHVFLGGNELPARWQGKPSFTILETGFGLGLNFLATWLAWQNDTQRCDQLQFISLEKHPFSVADLASAHCNWPELAPFSKELRRHWPPLTVGEHCLELAEGRIILRLVLGDALETLPKLEAVVDAFYLDGFSPAKNPELWSPAVFQNLARLAADGATLATWTVAGNVRRALSAAHFSLNRRPGFGSKREMLTGRFLRSGGCWC